MVERDAATREEISFWDAEAVRSGNDYSNGVSPKARECRDCRGAGWAEMVGGWWREVVKGGRRYDGMLGSVCWQRLMLPTEEE